MLLRDQHFRHVGIRLSLSVGYRRNSHSLEDELPPMSHAAKVTMKHHLRSELLRWARFGDLFEICAGSMLIR